MTKARCEAKFITDILEDGSVADQLVGWVFSLNDAPVSSWPREAFTASHAAASDFGPEAHVAATTNRFKARRCMDELDY